ncbi:MAG: M20 family metallopeptidase [Gemmataceae bacterium]|nr:M20 family metallopeptidase [Gemmataceae bacterium]
MSAVASLLRDLVALPSVNPMGRESAAEISCEHRVAAYLERFFRGLGVPYEKQQAAPGRENVVARFERPGAARTILFEAHQDTVPVTNMTVPPFEGKIEGNRMFGRGTCDVKGGMTSMLSAFARLVREKPANAANVTMACTVDEEHTFLGVQELAKRGIHADFAIVAEPTRLNIVHAHKGVVRWFIRTPGRACHSSAPEKGVNAIYRMGKLLVAMERYAEEVRASVVDPLLGPATISVGMIEGGTSVNTVPDRCSIEIDRRVVGGEDPRLVRDQVSDWLRTKGGIDFPFEATDTWICERALVPTKADEAVTRLGRAINEVAGTHKVHSVPFGTDAATISFAGVPAIVFGPGDIAQAHTIDEWVPLDEVEKAADILYRLATQAD